MDLIIDSSTKQSLIQYFSFRTSSSNPKVHVPFGMKALVEVEPDNPDFIVRWGELVYSDDERSKAARQQEAAEIWERMLVSRGDDPVTVSRVADLLRGAELTEKAISNYRQAISLAKSEPQYREYLGEYLHQLQRKDEALQVWEELASGDLHSARDRAGLEREALRGSRGRSGRRRHGTDDEFRAAANPRRTGSLEADSPGRRVHAGGLRQHGAADEFGEQLLDPVDEFVADAGPGG